MNRVSITSDTKKITIRHPVHSFIEWMFYIWDNQIVEVFLTYYASITVFYLNDIIKFGG